jgi:hypothetical protein
MQVFGSGGNLSVAVHGVRNVYPASHPVMNSQLPVRPAHEERNGCDMSAATAKPVVYEKSLQHCRRNARLITM